MFYVGAPDVPADEAGSAELPADEVSAGDSLAADVVELEAGAELSPPFSEGVISFLKNHLLF